MQYPLQIAELVQLISRTPNFFHECLTTGFIILPDRRVFQVQYNPFQIFLVLAQAGIRRNRRILKISRALRRCWNDLTYMAGLLIFGWSCQNILFTEIKTVVALRIDIWTPVDEDFVKSLAPLRSPVTERRGRFCNIDIFFRIFFENAASLMR